MDIQLTAYDRAFAWLWRSCPQVPFLDICDLAHSMTPDEGGDDE